MTIIQRGSASRYDTWFGRFISKDPIGFDGGSPNLYSYVLNDPINFTDPSGLTESMYDTPGYNPGGGSAWGWEQSDAQVYLGPEDEGIEPVYYDPVTLGAGACGAAYGAGWRASLQLHRPHHYFPEWKEKLWHLQLNIWKRGAKGSGKQYHFPIP